MKFLIFLLIVAGFIYYLRYRASTLKPANKHTQRSTSAKTISMVQCAYCGVHLPENDAIKRQGHTWCCEEHARLGNR